MSGNPIAVLVSGGGRSLENLAERIASGSLDARIALVLSDRDGIGALERSRRLELPTTVVPWRDCADAEEFGRRAFAAIAEAGCELVVLAGFLRLLVVPEPWHGRVINIHPALLPAFGGAGFWGDRIHRAVLESGAWFTGCTVHEVDEEYDRGRILLQRCIRVGDDDTVETLAARVFEQEQQALPEAIERFFAGRG